MNNNHNILNVLSWVFGLIVFGIGILNLVLAHPAPALMYFLLSCIYFPFVNHLLKKKYSFRIPAWIKLILGVVIIMFTFGVNTWVI
jgi:hypothetical protein